ncbi:MAG: arsenosugar biosynthesis radical SAM (seleno)protein ArsS [Candidatus Binatia bacterium]
MDTLPAHPDTESVPPARFASVLQRHGLWPLRRDALRTLQVNVGKRCNQACHHCHVDAGPKRAEVMTRATAERVLALLAASPAIDTIDLTGGAPELNPNFRFLVEGARRGGRRVIDRCNLTVLGEPGLEGMPEFLAANQVEIVCSLPCYTAKNVDQQRGHGVFDRSIAALRTLNRLGYGHAGSPLVLNLVHNPLGAFLPPPQAALERDYRHELGRCFGIEFHHLFTITNMPIKRFAEQLARWGQHEAYMGLLVNHFNPAAVAGLMCRSLVSVGWDGKLYDCDFNQMLDLPVPGGAHTIFDMRSFEDLADTPIATREHCFGCTAGAGSSCGGATVSEDA